MRARPKWWLAFIVAPAALFCLDLILSLWRPAPARFPEQFSAPYLDAVAREMTKSPPTLVIGDSVLWGFKIDEADTAVARLRAALPGANLRNVSFEGGSPVNDAIMLRYLLARGVRPKAVLFNVNQKEFSEADSAFKTLYPSLGLAAQSVIDPADRTALDPKTAIDHRTLLDRTVESAWRLYRMRVDVRERLFGSDDAASALLAVVQRISGAANRAAAAKKLTAAKFEGTYDLSPLDPANVSVAYYKRFLAELCAAHVPAIGFLTPTNHVLLHEYIDVPEYDANVKAAATMSPCATTRFVNLDRAIPSSEFIDNDHLTPRGNALLAERLEPLLASIVK